MKHKSCKHNVLFCACPECWYFMAQCVYQFTEITPPPSSSSSSTSSVLSPPVPPSPSPAEVARLEKFLDYLENLENNLNWWEGNIDKMCEHLKTLLDECFCKKLGPFNILVEVQNLRNNRYSKRILGHKIEKKFRTSLKVIQVFSIDNKLDVVYSLKNGRKDQFYTVNSLCKFNKGYNSESILLLMNPNLLYANEEN